jgi:hypothetical protein
VTRSRVGFGVLVVFALVLAAVPIDLVSRGAAQTATAPNGTAVLSTGGTPGLFQRVYSVGLCRQTSSGGWRAEVDVQPPTAFARSSGSNQRITWEPRVYQHYPDLHTPQVIRTGTVQSRSVAAGASTRFDTETFTDFPVGPYFVAGGLLTWVEGSTVRGTSEFVYLPHDSYIDGSISSLSGGCPPAVRPEMSLSTYRTTVNVTVRLTGRFFPISAPVEVTWGGKTLATVMSDNQGNVQASLRVPATPLGDYRIGLQFGLWWTPSAVLTVVPRLKVIPDEAARGETVKISLRGFAKREVVRIRWKQGTRWVELGRVTMSNTGSGELYIPVPGWATDGQHSVRGDGSIGRAQTNAVSVSGGPLVTIASESSPSPSSTATPDASPVPDSTATAEATMTVTAEPTSPAITPTVTETPIATATETPQAIETSTPVETATAGPAESPPTETTTDTGSSGG